MLMFITVSIENMTFSARFRQNTYRKGQRSIIAYCETKEQLYEIPTTHKTPKLLFVAKCIHKFVFN